MPGSPNCSPNSHRKSPRNVLRVFYVYLEIQCDSKSYFGFAVDKLFELAHTEIASSRNPCVITLPVMVLRKGKPPREKLACEKYIFCRYAVFLQFISSLFHR